MCAKSKGGREEPHDPTQVTREFFFDLCGIMRERPACTVPVVMAARMRTYET
jgi:hypothetical protein